MLSAEQSRGAIPPLTIASHQFGYGIGEPQNRRQTRSPSHRSCLQDNQLWQEPDRRGIAIDRDLRLLSTSLSNVEFQLSNCFWLRISTRCGRWSYRPVAV